MSLHRSVHSAVDRLPHRWKALRVWRTAVVHVCWTLHHMSGYVLLGFTKGCCVTLSMP
jgi:hypothetical protein